MEIALAVFGAVFGAVIGVALTYLVPFVIEWTRSKRRKNINGPWFSAWQPVSGESNEFVYQELAIKTTLSGTKVKSIGHVDRYEWEADIKEGKPRDIRRIVVFHEKSIWCKRYRRAESHFMWPDDVRLFHSAPSYGEKENS